MYQNEKLILPRHLQNMVSEFKKLNTTQSFDGSNITLFASVNGNLHCPCGSSDVGILYPGKTTNLEDGSVFASRVDQGNYSFYFMKIKCFHCLLEQLVFDYDLHGYEAVFCPESCTPSAPRPELFEWHCRQCSSDHFNLEIALEYHIDDMAIEDLFDDPQTAENVAWDAIFEAFSAINISLTCIQCNKHESNFITAETM
jgi:ribosomal protein S27E